jgi:hypothetical protein
VLENKELEAWALGTYFKFIAELVEHIAMLFRRNPHFDSGIS